MRAAPWTNLIDLGCASVRFGAHGEETSPSRPWDFEHWGDGATEIYHIGRGKFSDVVVTIPKAMHPEASMRQDEEHPHEGPEPDNPLAASTAMPRTIRHARGPRRGLSPSRERFLAASKRRKHDSQFAQIPKGRVGWLGWLGRIAHDLSTVAKSLTTDPD